MKLRLLCLSLILMFSLQFQAFADAPKYSYMRVVMVGTLTEPTMLVMDETGKHEQVPLKPTIQLNKEKTIANLTDNEETLLKKLNELGKKGWELISVENSGSQTYYTLKKPLP